MKHYVGLDVSLNEVSIRVVDADDGFILDRFSCQSCGYQAYADLNAGQVIAIKRMWRESLPKSQRPKLMSELKENYSFKPAIPR